MRVSRIIASLCVFFAAGVCSAGEGERDAALVLGDSVAFGYISTVGYDYFYKRPANFLGFADRLGSAFGLDVVNAGCPGETTGSFLSAAARDNGCREYRSLYPLHAAYPSTQLAFATAYLASHTNVRLVTVTLGANDGLLLEQDCAANPANTTAAAVAECIAAGAPAMLATVAGNIQALLAHLRAAGYAGPIVVTNYYSLDYSDAAATSLTAALDAAIAAPAAAYGAVVADLFGAFGAAAAAPALGGKTCATGLLNPDVSQPFLCNIHPAQTGHELIAKTIIRVLPK